MSDEKKYHKFHSTFPTAKYIFKNGEIAQFQNGIYLTENPLKIEELTEEIKLGNPYLFVGDKAVVTAEDMDPLAALKKKIIAEHEAKRGIMNSQNKGV